MRLSHLDAAADFGRANDGNLFKIYNIEDHTLVVISYEIYETSLCQVL